MGSDSEPSGFEIDASGRHSDRLRSNNESSRCDSDPSGCHSDPLTYVWGSGSTAASFTATPHSADISDSGICAFFVF